MRRHALALAIAAAALSCGPSVRRDLGSVRLSQITYDDMCRLQDFFDQRAASHAPPYRSTDEQSTETSREERDERGRLSRVIVGEGTYVLSARTDRARFRRLLQDEYRRVPGDMRLTAREGEVTVHLTWWQAGGIRHARNDQDIVITSDGKSWEFPPHPCVGEFLFGEPAYVMRRCFLEAERARAEGRVPGECSLPSVHTRAPADAAAPAADAALPAPDADPALAAPVVPALFPSTDGGALDAAVDGAVDAPDVPASPADGARDAAADLPRAR